MIGGVYGALLGYLKRCGGEWLIPCRGDGERLFLADFLKGREPVTRKISSQEVIRNCTRCGDAREKLEGYGTGENGIMIILHAPSMVSRAQRNKYKQESSMLLKNMMKAIGVDVMQCYITSLIKCDSGDSPTSPVQSPGVMFNNCEELLALEISEKKPRMAIVMGDMKPLKRLKDASGDVGWYAIDHPIVLIDNPEIKRSAWNTLKIIKSHLDEL